MASEALDFSLKKKRLSVKAEAEPSQITDNYSSEGSAPSPHHDPTYHSALAMPGLSGLLTIPQGALSPSMPHTPPHDPRARFLDQLRNVCGERAGPDSSGPQTPPHDPRARFLDQLRNVCGERAGPDSSGPQTPPHDPRARFLDQLRNVCGERAGPDSSGPQTPPHDPRARFLDQLRNVCGERPGPDSSGPQTPPLQVSPGQAPLGSGVPDLRQLSQFFALTGLSPDSLFPTTSLAMATLSRRRRSTPSVSSSLDEAEPSPPKKGKPGVPDKEKVGFEGPSFFLFPTTSPAMALSRRRRSTPSVSSSLDEAEPSPPKKGKPGVPDKEKVGFEGPSFFLFPTTSPAMALSRRRRSTPSVSSSLDEAEPSPPKKGKPGVPDKEKVGFEGPSFFLFPTTSPAMALSRRRRSTPSVSSSLDEAEPSPPKKGKPGVPDKEKVGFEGPSFFLFPTTSPAMALSRRRRSTPSVSSSLDEAEPSPPKKGKPGVPDKEKVGFEGPSFFLFPTTSPAMALSRRRRSTPSVSSSLDEAEPSPPKKGKPGVPDKEKVGFEGPSFFLFPTTSPAMALSRRRRSTPSVSSSLDEAEPSPPKKGKPGVPDKEKDSSYWERRRKNNVAAKRSRDARRAKEEDIAMRASILEQENLRLRAELTVLKQQTSQLHLVLYEQAQRLKNV